ncbi:Sugar phosphate exchanger 2 [Thelohanellus kitauei]|uniref:Sugar phosphate exchanger 3 n=1 Tax=Thelohanellus kitauei TaxID=669202 RepID=A0A0C2IEJ0_THEKT|nr:Sugar phosphate exchanger 2 [Thelohanellus kitauei]
MLGFLKNYSSPRGNLLGSKMFGSESRGSRKNLNIFIVLFVTFISYCMLHACRKSLPVAKNKLQGKCEPPNETCVDGFPPFDGPSRFKYFTIMDAAWAFPYAIGMPFMGRAAEKTSRKLFLFLSLFFTGALMIIFGLGDYLDIHLLYFYVVLQILNGLVQSAGWPCIISIVSCWVPKAALGSILGIWGNHYAVGNILGQTLSSVFVEHHWGMAFISNGILCIGSSILVVLFLASKPETMGFESEAAHVQKHDYGSIQTASTGVKNYDINPSMAGYMASLFDIGGIFGNIATGILLDLVKKGGCLCFVLQVLSSLTLFLFARFGSESLVICIILLLITGFFINSPNALITGTISASLGKNLGLQGNKKASATVSAIINGIGSLGAAFAPLIVHRVSLLVNTYIDPRAGIM